MKIQLNFFGVMHNKVWDEQMQDHSKERLLPNERADRMTPKNARTYLSQ